MSKCIKCLEQDLRSRTDRCIVLESEIVSMEGKNKALQEANNSSILCLKAFQKEVEGLKVERNSAKHYNRTLINVNSELRDEIKELKLKNMELASNPPVIMQCCKKCK
jgi:hypothetical protein